MLETMHDEAVKSVKFVKSKTRKINGYRQFHTLYEIIILWRILYLIERESQFSGANQFELTSE